MGRVHPRVGSGPDFSLVGWVESGPFVWVTLNYTKHYAKWPTVRPTDLYAYLLITFASVTDCVKNKCFIHEC